MNAPIKPETLSIDLDLAEIIKGMTLEDLFGEIHSPGHESRLGHYMYVASGKLFYPCDPRPEEIDIRDIAVGVSRQFRFGGHTKRGMVVAEHLWHAPDLVPQEFKLEAILHDAAEGYISDKIRPLKALPIFGDIYLKIESGIERTIAAKFGLVYPWPKEVKLADEMLLHAEIAQNVASTAKAVHFNKAVYDRENEKPQHIEFQYWTPELARIMFLDKFKNLANERGIDTFGLI